MVAHACAVVTADMVRKEWYEDVVWACFVARAWG